MFMEFCDRGELFDYISKDYAKLSALHLLDIMTQMSLGLQAMHNLVDEKGKQIPLIHRDLKLENYLLKTDSDTGELIVKLCDLGYAKQ